MSTRGRQITYAMLAAAGVVVPWFYNLEFTRHHGGFSLGTYLAEIYANFASTSIAYDILIALLAFLVWSFFEARRLGMKHWWLLPILSIFISFAFAFPLFLFLRERRLSA